MQHGTPRQKGLWFWCPCMEINVRVQYNGGFLLDIILLIRYGYIGNPFDTMKRFCLYSQCSHLSLYRHFSPEGGCSECLDAFRFFLIPLRPCTTGFEFNTSMTLVSVSNHGFAPSLRDVFKQCSSSGPVIEGEGTFNLSCDQTTCHRIPDIRERVTGACGHRRILS